MNNSVIKKLKSNVIIVSIIVTVVFLLMNIALFLINNNFLLNKVQTENQAFLDITRHIINDNDDIHIALEYVEHYTHIHHVEIEVMDENDTMLFSSNIAHLYTYQYLLETDKGNFTIFMDNTESTTVVSFQRNTAYVNATLFVVYIGSILTLFYVNRKSIKQLNSDVSNVLQLIEGKAKDNQDFHYNEFEYINQVVVEYLEEIDFLNEQKETNMKGLAHDIKTPLTLIYTYLSKLSKGKTVSEVEIEKSYQAARRINELVEGIIDSNINKQVKEINVSSIVNKKIEEYKGFLSQKQISMESQVEDDLVVMWNDKDLERVIDNLISNAYYYSKENSVLSIHTYKQHKKVLIECISTPIQIDEVDVNNLFKKGYRGTHLKNESGKGLGLYITKLLVANAGGNISVETINENVKFTIKL